jgi:hypothetical protein
MEIIYIFHTILIRLLICSEVRPSSTVAKGNGIRILEKCSSPCDQWLVSLFAARRWACGHTSEWAKELPLFKALIASLRGGGLPSARVPICTTMAIPLSLIFVIVCLTSRPKIRLKRDRPKPALRIFDVELRCNTWLPLARI